MWGHVEIKSEAQCTVCVSELSRVKPKERTQNPIVIHFILITHYVSKTRPCREVATSRTHILKWIRLSCDIKFTPMLINHTETTNNILQTE